MIAVQRAFHRDLTYIQVMWKGILIALGSLLLLAACALPQVVETDAVRAGAGQTVTLSETGVSVAEKQALAQLLEQAGYRVAANGSSRAVVRFNVGDEETDVKGFEFPHYETVREVRFINGRERVFTEEIFVGYKTYYQVSTVYPARAELVLTDDTGEQAIRTVRTRGECGDAGQLRPVLMQQLLETSGPGSLEIELPSC